MTTPAHASAPPSSFAASPLFWLLLIALLASIGLALRLPNRRLAVAAAILIGAYFLLLLFWPN